MNLTNLISEETKVWMNDVLFLVPNWKWLGLVTAIVLGFIIHFIALRFFGFIKDSPHIRNRLSGFFRHYADLNSHKPSAWLVSAAFFLVCTNALGLPEDIDRFLEVITKMIMALSLIRIVYLAVEAFGRVLGDRVKSTENTLDDQLAPFVTKTLKALVLILGGLIVIQNFGINVVSLLAGLGLGGLALALAAQDTAANIFGSITIIADRPFQVGDHIKFNSGVEGIVEDVGFRSTRIRTPYKSLVTIPNSIVAKENVENLSARAGRRIRHTVGFTYDTPVEKIQTFIKHVNQFIIAHPKTAKDTIFTSFTTLGDFSLGVLISFFTNVNDPDIEFEVQQDLLFKMLTLAKELEIEYAFPTQTQYMYQPKEDGTAPQKEIRI